MKKQNQPKSSVWRKIGLLLLNFALFYLLLQLIILLSERTGILAIYYVGTSLYGVAIAVSFVAFYVLNGFTFDRAERNIDELPENWSNDKKMEFLGKQSENKEKARSLIYIILPLLLTIAVSYIGLMFIK